MIIGGKYFEDISKFRLNLDYKKNYNLYINGREAFASILKEVSFKKQTIYLPNYICGSLLKAIRKFNLKVKFYNIDNNFNYSVPEVKNSIILLINYFGIKKKLSDNIILNNIIIEDTTLSAESFKKYNSKNKTNYFYFGSFRKLFTSLVCGYSSIKNNHKKTNYLIEKFFMQCVSASLIKSQYGNIMNTYQSNNIEKFYLKIFQDFESIFDKNNLNYKPNNIFVSYLSQLNYKKELNLRKQRYFILQKKLKNIKNIKILYTHEYSFFIFLEKKKKKLIEFLKRYNIYLSAYWTKPSQIKKKLTHNLYNALIIIPTDSIYTKEQIYFLSDKIKLFYKRKFNN